MRKRVPGWFAPAGVVLALAGCGSSTVVQDPGTASDLGAWQPPSDLSGCASVSAQVTFENCPAPAEDGGLPRCTGAAPLEVTLVPLTSPGIKITSRLWSLSDGGAPAESFTELPAVKYVMPGSYDVRLVVMSEKCGQASAKASLEVTTVSTGGKCKVDAQCRRGDSCLCTSAAADGGAGCPGELADGLCTRLCTGGSCDPSSEACIDFSRTTWNAPELAEQAFRHPLCLPTCTTDKQCADIHPGFTCRELPALVDRAGAGGAITWRKACFGKTAWDDGHSCADANGRPTPGDCAGGLCLPIGARNLCTSPCESDPCPSTAACAVFNFDPSHPICIARCEGKSACSDPLLDCRGPDPLGWFGFSLAKGQPMGGTYCVPRRCAGDGECTPAGRCANPGAPPDAGVRTDGGASVLFCVP